MKISGKLVIHLKIQMLNKEKLIKDLKLMKNLLPLLKEVKVGFEDLFIGIKYIIKYKVT